MGPEEKQEREALRNSKYHREIWSRCWVDSLLLNGALGCWLQPLSAQSSTSTSGIFTRLTTKLGGEQSLQWKGLSLCLCVLPHLPTPGLHPDVTLAHCVWDGFLSTEKRHPWWTPRKRRRWMSPTSCFHPSLSAAPGYSADGQASG